MLPTRFSTALAACFLAATTSLAQASERPVELPPAEFQGLLRFVDTEYGMECVYVVAHLEDRGSMVVIAKLTQPVEDDAGEPVPAELVQPGARVRVEYDGLLSDGVPPRVHATRAVLLAPANGPRWVGFVGGVEASEEGTTVQLQATPGGPVAATAWVPAGTPVYDAEATPLDLGALPAGAYVSIRHDGQAADDDVVELVAEAVEVF